MLFESQVAPQNGAFPVPSKPVTPFLGVVKYLSPDRAAEVPKNNHHKYADPSPHAGRMLTVYGENFNKADPVSIFFGSDPSPLVEMRCQEVLGCLPPESGATSKRRHIIIVRSDGVMFPSSVLYP